MDELEHIKEIERAEGLNRENLALKTGIKYTRLRNAIGGQVKLRHEEIELIGNVFPEYKLWLAYGEEIPEAGQISPTTKESQIDYENQG